MLYRKSPPQPTKLLLRVVAAAGAGALVVACSSSASGSTCMPGGCGEPADSGSNDGAQMEDGPHGLVPMDAAPDHPLVGVVPMHDGGTD